MTGATHQIILKVDDDLNGRIERFGTYLQAQQPTGIKLTRMDAMRVLLHKGLEEFETNET